MSNNPASDGLKQALWQYVQSGTFEASTPPPTNQHTFMVCSAIANTTIATLKSKACWTSFERGSISSPPPLPSKWELDYCVICCKGFLPDESNAWYISHNHTSGLHFDCWKEWSWENEKCPQCLEPYNRSEDFIMNGALIDVPWVEHRPSSTVEDNLSNAKEPQIQVTWRSRRRWSF